MSLDQAFLLSSGGALFLGVFLVAVLMAQGGRAARSQQILGLLILACALNAAHPVLTHVFLGPTRGSDQFFEPLQFLLAPLMTGYASSLLQSGFPLRARHLLHFLPALAAFAVSVAFTLHDNPSRPWITIALWTALSIQMVAYLIPAIRILRRHQSSLKARVSNLERVDLDWLRWFYVVLVSLCLVAWAVLVMLLHDHSRLGVSYCISLAMTVAVWVLGYRGLVQKVPETPESTEDSTPGRIEPPGRIETPVEPPEPVEPVEPAEPVEPVEPPRPAPRTELEHRLLELMSRQKPHLDPDLGLDGLARRLEVPRNQLSGLINQRLGVNFYDFVNDYRVREFKALLADPAKADEKLLTLAFEAGFSSKATFNKVVLKLTGKTPSELRAESTRGRDIEARSSR
ncbi:helix-turn-helix domain-containing protein [Nannocystaceae bacterium ST9]